MEDFMMGYLALAFLAGGIFGMAGTAILASGPKTRLFSENSVLCKRLEFLEQEVQKRKYWPVKDPRPSVHTLVN